MVEKEEAPGNIINLSPRSLVMVLARKTQELPSTVDLLHAASGKGLEPRLPLWEQGPPSTKGLLTVDYPI